MTFTASEKESLRRYLGYSPLEQSELTTAITRLEAGNVLAVATVQGLLREVRKIEQLIRSDRPFASRTFQSNSGGTAQFSPVMRKDYPREEAQRLIDEIAATLQVRVITPMFTTGFTTRGRLRRG